MTRASETAKTAACGALKKRAWDLRVRIWTMKVLNEIWRFINETLMIHIGGAMIFPASVPFRRMPSNQLTEVCA